MRITRTVRWGSDPAASKNPALATPAGRLLVGIIRYGHVVDQHFNRRIVALVAEIERSMPATGHELAQKAWAVGLRGIGTSSHKGEPDAEWWDELLQALRGELVIRHELPAPSSATSEVSNVSTACS